MYCDLLFFWADSLWPTLWARFHSYLFWTNCDLSSKGSDHKCSIKVVQIFHDSFVWALKMFILQLLLLFQPLRTFHCLNNQGLLDKNFEACSQHDRDPLIFHLSYSGFVRWSMAVCMRNWHKLPTQSQMALELACPYHHKSKIKDAYFCNSSILFFSFSRSASALRVPRSLR